MQNILFKIKNFKERTLWSTEDLSTYEVIYKPKIDVISSRDGNFQDLLLETICLLSDNKKESSINISIQKKFPQKYETKIRKLFDLFSNYYTIKIYYKKLF